MTELNFALLEPSENTMSFDPLPDGWYSAVVVEEEKRESAAGNSYLAVTFEVTGPDHAGRKIWSNFNLWHPDEKVLEIAQRQFSDMALACGMSSCKDSGELLNNHLDIMLKTEAGNGDYGPKNKVVAYRAAPQPTLRPFEVSTAPAPDSEEPPWQRQAS